MSLVYSCCHTHTGRVTNDCNAGRGLSSHFKKVSIPFSDIPTMTLRNNYIFSDNTVSCWFKAHGATRDCVQFVICRLKYSHHQLASDGWYVNSTSYEFLGMSTIYFLHNNHLFKFNCPLVTKTTNKNKTPWVQSAKRLIPTERPPLVGEISAHFGE
jgi:hypothetical protein